MKIKIKKNTERIKNIIELKCNIELDIHFKTYQIYFFPQNVKHPST
jgi:hypothetical protein